MEPDDGTVASFRDQVRPLQWYVLLFELSFMAAGVYLVIRGGLGEFPASDNAPAIVFGILFIAVSAPLLLASAPVFRRRTVSSTTLSVPKVFGRRVLELSEIAGVGLLGVSGRYPMWVLYVWTAEGTRRGVGLTVKKRIRHPWTEDLDGDRLPNSTAGRAATTIYTRALALQGPNGTLATRQMQKHVRRVLEPTTVAFWSPDGDKGQLEMSGSGTGVPA